MVTISLRRDDKKSMTLWVTLNTTLKVLQILAVMIRDRVNLSQLHGRTDGFSPVDNQAVANIVITPAGGMHELERGGQVAVRFAGGTEYYTFEQIVELFLGETNASSS